MCNFLADIRQKVARGCGLSLLRASWRGRPDFCIALARPPRRTCRRERVLSLLGRGGPECFAPKFGANPPLGRPELQSADGRKGGCLWARTPANRSCPHAE